MPAVRQTRILDLLKELISRDEWDHLILVPRRNGTTFAFQHVSEGMDEVTTTHEITGNGCVETLQWPSGRRIVAVCMSAVAESRVRADTEWHVVHDIRVGV